MAYKNILVHVGSDARSTVRIDHAIALARQFDAHLTGLFVAPRPALPFGLDGVASVDIYPLLEEHLQGLAERARATFERQVQRHGPVQHEWRSQIGNPVDAVSLNARYHDLVVLGQDDPSRPVDGLPPGFAGSVALGAGRPVLVLPHSGEYDSLGKRVLLAWNGRPEATRALTDALPLLQRASRVIVLVVNADSEPGSHGQAPGSDIALYLARHGVRAEVLNQTVFGVDAGSVLLSSAADLEVDLMVMGAYGHSRLLERILGGTTQVLLDSMTVPVLMSH